MALGIWVAVTTKDHPHSYDAAVGRVTDHERFNIGARGGLAMDGVVVGNGTVARKGK